MTKYPRLLNSNLEEIKRVTPYDGSVTLNIVPLSTASVTINVSEGVKNGNWMEMFTERGSAGIFRVRSIDDQYGDDMASVEMDHAVVEVGDYVIEGKIYEKSTLSAALNKVFEYYKGNKWTMIAGNHSDEVMIDLSGESVLEGLLSILEQEPKYYMTFRFDTSPWQIRISERGTSVSAEGRLSRNVLSASVTYDESELYTRVYVEYGDNGETKTLILDSGSARKSKYGTREYFMSQSEYTEEEARTAGKTYLHNHQDPNVAVTIDGYDLSTITGESLDTFEIGKLYRLAVPKYGLNVEEVITSLNWTSLYVNPNDITVSLADAEDPVVSYMKQTRKSGSGTKKQLDKASERFRRTLIETESYWAQTMEDMEEDLHSQIVQTASEIRQSLWAAKSQLYSYILQTATNIMMHVGNEINDLHAELEVTASEIRAAVWASKSELYSTIVQTATNIMTHVGNVQSDLHSEIEETASQIRASVWAAQSSLYSTIVQTSTSIMTHVGDVQSGLHSEILQTASEIRSAVYEAQSSLYSTIAQTSTSILTHVGNVQSGLHSEILQTASEIKSTVDSAKSSLWSSIAQTSTQISLKVGKGEVISSINQTAESITISASKINLSGYVKATDLTADWLSAKIADLTTVTMRAATITGSLYVSTGQQSQNVTAAIWDLWLVDNQDNTYTLKRKRMSDSAWVDVGTFSRAATVKVSGSWSGRTFTVSADDNGTTLPKSGIVYDGIVYDTQGQTTVSGKTVYHDFIVYADDGNGDAGAQIMKKSCGIDATAVYNNGWNYGLTQRTMWGRAALSTEQAIKSLSYGEKWTVGFTFTKADGTTEESKYTLQAPAQQTIPAIQGVWLGTQYSGVYWNAYAHTSDGVDHGPVYCDCTAPYNQGVADAYASLSDAGVARSADYASQSQQTLSTITSNGNYYYRLRVRDTGGNTRFTYYYTLPVSVSDSNPEKHHTSVTFTRGDPVDPGGNAYRYYADIGNNITGGKSSVTFWI